MTTRVEPAIDARSLSKSYGTQRGIVEVDLAAAAGEVVGLVGANGAGKTTFIRTMLDFIRPTAGDVRVFGLDSVRDSVEVRRRTAYLPGDLVLPPRTTGSDALRRYSAGRPPLDPARVKTLASRLDLDLSRKVEDLSKGNRQKVGLMIAFAPHVDLLVLDEPTSGLDPLLQREFASLIAEVANDGVTVLLSSHVMSEVEQVAQRVALMRDGRIAAVDDLAAIHARARRRGRVRALDPDDLSRIADALRATDSITNSTVDGDVVAFACVGSMDEVIKTLSRFGIAELDVAHSDLEDAFFSTYDDAACGEGKAS
ncbi:MAG TPA: ABC transporter ATP-binding protein [Mycobacteriales bacterium]|nr:ABC transporter ATP-binding protein [Mycobacteriales bacterium]